MVFAPGAAAALEQFVKVAGQRWLADHQLQAGIRLEQGFELAKGECGLDQYGPQD